MGKPFIVNIEALEVGMQLYPLSPGNRSVNLLFTSG
jgi:hypothetical protein